MTDVSYSIGANTTKYERAMQRLRRTNTNFASQLKSSWGIIGAAGVAAFTAITAVVVSGTKSLAEFERLTLRTEALVKATGDAAGISAKELTGFAKALDLATLADRDQILGAINAMQTFKSVTGEVFTRSIELSQDLSEVLGSDLRGQAVQLGKALEDPIKGLTALRRVGVSFTDTQKETIKNLVESNKLYQAQSMILDTIAGQVGGAGAAAAGGLAGQFDTLSYRWREFKESLSGTETATSGINAISTALGKVTEAIQEAEREHRSFLSYISGSAAIVEKALQMSRGAPGGESYTGKISRAAGYEEYVAESKSVKGKITPETPGYKDYVADIAKRKKEIETAKAIEGQAEIEKFTESPLMKAMFAEVDQAAEIEELITQKKLEEQERRKQATEEYAAWEFSQFGEQADRIIEMEQRKAQEQVELQRSVVAGIGDALRQAGRQNETAFKAYQAFQIAQTTITGIAAAVKAWDAGMATGGPWAPAVAAGYAAASLAWTGAQLAAIGGSSFSSSASSTTASTTTDTTSTTDLDSINTESNKPALHITIEGDFIGDELWVDKLVDKINDAEDRDVYVNKTRYAGELS